MSELAPGPGWYADPHGAAVRRYWDGAAWTPHVIDATGAPGVDGQGHPLSPQGASQPVLVQTVVHSSQTIVVGAKSMAAAILLTLFFGPLGLLYASVVGGLILMAVTILTAGFGLVVTWPAAILWAIVAVANDNRPRMTAGSQVVYATQHHPPTPPARPDGAPAGAPFPPALPPAPSP